jgi:ribosomal protein S18 acetylase RimI-like enzyme
MMSGVEGRTVRLREMRADEYDAYTEQRERETAESLSSSMPYADGVTEARRGTARFLPDGLATAGHRLLVAEDTGGAVVGHVWLGLADPRTGSPLVAYLYDIRVPEAHRRRGYANAILAGVEQIARDAGAQSLGLNVFGGNHGAIALYASRGYEVTTQQMSLNLGTPHSQR